MPAPIQFNLATFQIDDPMDADPDNHIYLQGWQITRRGGLEPDVWTATVAAHNLPVSITDVSVEISGTLKLWYTEDATVGGTPDVTLGAVAIVDLQADLVGRKPGDSADSVLTYRIAIADHRRAFVEPRGGRLFDGLLNRDPLPDGETLFTNGELMQKCADAMGITLTVAATVNDVDPLREVDWQGAHAPTALQELLEHTGHVYAPLISGHAQVMKPGTGSAPSVPAGRLVRTVTVSSIDRRPSEVIFLSAPAAKIHTYNSDSASPPAWKFVVQDPDDDQWKPLADVACLNSGTTPLEVWQLQFSNLGEDVQAKMREQLYCCIQLDPEAYPPGKAQLLPRWLDTDLMGLVPFIGPTDTLLVKDITGSFGQHNDELDLLARQVVTEANVLIFPHPLMKLATPDSSIAIQHLNGLHIPFAEADLKPTFSVEAWNADDEQRVYAVYGFTSTGIALTTMSEIAARDKLTGYRPNVCIYNQPDLLQVVVDPEGAATTNRSDMLDRAETYAQGLVRLDTAAMQLMPIKGFLAVELTGAVSEVSYDPDSVSTAVTLNGWHCTRRGGEGRHNG